MNLKNKGFNLKALFKAITGACVGYIMYVALKNGKIIDELEDEIDDLAAHADNADVKLRIKRLIQRKKRYDQLFVTLRSITDHLDTGKDVSVSGRDS